MSLRTYHAKRKFQKTPEPRGRAKGQGGALRFVVQKHHASRLHYDFRLELDGVLKSWAVPKGPSLQPGDKRLAIMVEDHPLDYRRFEGIIPKGNYGAGTVMVWDEGTYHPRQTTDRAEAEKIVREGIDQGRLSVVLEGRKLRGVFSLVRMKWGERKNEWLLMKRTDEWATQEDVTQQDLSVSTGRTLEEIARNERPHPARARAKPAGKKKLKKIKVRAGVKRAMPTDVKPMLATFVAEAFDRPGWIFELKWDGYRAIAEVSRRGVALYSRNHLSFEHRFAPIVESLSQLNCEAVLDGEVVVVDSQGRAQFQLLQNYQKTGQGQLLYYAFDLLYLNGRDLQSLPLQRRKEYLPKTLTGLSNVRVSEHVEEHGIAFFQAVAAKGLEGIIAKDTKSPYRQGIRSPSWLKIKTHKRQEAVICGFTEPRGSRKNLGALVLGVYEGDELVYIGHTGGGFDTQELTELRSILDPLVQRACPFRAKPKTNAPVHWLSPKLVCEVTFQDWSTDGLMRHPIFVGLRKDKSASAVRREKSQATADVLEEEKLRGHHPSVKGYLTSPSKQATPGPGQPVLTNLSKVYWPEEGYTKEDLINYYREVAPFILPYLRDRPESLHRHPNGITGQSFFQKDMSKQPPPPWIKTVAIDADSPEKPIRYLVCQDKATLLYMANLGCIELNPWNSRIGSPDKPDYMIIDLDPQDVPWAQVIEAAQMVRKTLDEAEGACMCKTSGKRGLHVVVPLGARYDYEPTRQFGEIIATIVQRKLPNSTSVARRPALRPKRVYLDFLQNRRGQTLAAPYSVRPYPGATVSTPLTWQEVTKKLDPSRFTIRTIPQRLDKVGDLWKPVLGKGIDLAACLQRLHLA